MSYKVLITGSTGMVGKGVLYECLDHPDIDTVILLNRRSIDIQHPKIKELIVEDFTDLSSLTPEYSNVDACYHCMGVSALGKSEAEYKAITYDITLDLGNRLLTQNPNMIFCYVSGQGTNADSKTMWSRVKGKTEQDLKALGFRKVVLFRPGFIQPLKGITSSTGWYDLIYKVVGPLYPITRRLFPNGMTNTTSLGIAMINCLLVDTHPQILENKEINELAQTTPN